MKEENKGSSKNNWRRIFRKKWFFPAVYLTVAALLLAVVVWYQNLDNQIPSGDDQDLAGDYSPTPHDEDAEAVMDQQEVVLMPVGDDEEQAEIVTKFFDYNSDQEDRENALILYNNRYYQSTGIDIKFADDAAFDVVASLSGTVTDLKEDPLLGNVVVLSHGNDVTTHYASLGEVNVELEDEVKQGDVIGTAGQNLFGKDNGTHVHFELRKEGKEVNPESFFNQPVSKLDSESEEAAENDAPDNDGEENGEQTEETDEEESDANVEESENDESNDDDDDSTDEEDSNE
ncbi:M23 family metallopeptidase [Ornithinibacillus halophilus]|uniref:Stage II sporulation protein Q n=1 Tax=Ornithinibacillus halophilus TaxID=930117 RepID=A0A1M5N604_9BACI|nr:M23 family metallopeptidase [Ornithinibacillus halophilus]SHG84941.1 stage II sporulation protein Q [Ornithinibacillus halophilus]